MGKRTKILIISLVSFAALILCGVLTWSIVKNTSYKPLDKCFITSVSKAQLCSASASYVSYSQISPYLIESVIVSEDDKFFFHKGVDWKELKNSMWLNLKHFSYKRGGSTITQQLVKNAYLSQRKSITRKIKEMAIAYDIENKYSKKLILEKYLNAIEYGQDLWGIKNAANFYFKKEPADLGVLESLYLTILLPNPKSYSSSFRNKKLTYYQKRRIKLLIKRLTRKRVIDQDYAKILIDDIDGFPWGIEDADLEGEETPVATDLSDPNLNFSGEAEEAIEQTEKEVEEVTETEEPTNDVKEKTEEEVIQEFLKNEEDQN